MQIKEEKCEPRSNSYGVVNITAEALSNRIAETPIQALGKRYIFQINQQKNFPPPPPLLLLDTPPSPCQLMKLFFSGILGRKRNFSAIQTVITSFLSF